MNEYFVKDSYYSFNVTSYALKHKNRPDTAGFAISSPKNVPQDVMLNSWCPREKRPSATLWFIASKT